MIIYKTNTPPPPFLYTEPHPFRQLTRSEARQVLREGQRLQPSMSTRLVVMMYDCGLIEVVPGNKHAATWREWRAAIYYGLTKMRA